MLTNRMIATAMMAVVMGMGTAMAMDGTTKPTVEPTQRGHDHNVSNNNSQGAVSNPGYDTTTKATAQRYSTTVRSGTSVRRHNPGAEAVEYREAAAPMTNYAAPSYDARVDRSAKPALQAMQSQGR